MLKQEEKNKIHKIFAFILTLVLVFQIIGPVFLYPKSAWGTGMPVTDYIKLAWDKIWNILEKTLKTGTAVAFKNALKTFFGRIAYDAAVWLGTGDEGQKPLLFTEEWEKYLDDVKDDAVGDFIDTLIEGQEGRCAESGKSCRTDADCGYSIIDGKVVTPEKCVGAWGVGFNVCEPPEIGAKLAITWGIGQEIKPRKPRCKYSEMKKNWDKIEFRTDSEYLKNFLSNFSASFAPEENDLGIYLTLQGKMQEMKASKRLGSTLERMVAEGWKAVKSKVSKKIETPATLVKEEAKEMTKKKSLWEQIYTNEIVADTIGIFFNTLANKYLSRLKKGMWKASDLLKKDREERESKGLWTFKELEGSFSGGRKAAEAVFASLKMTNLKTGGEYDLLSQFIVCPSDRRFASIENCVIDQNFVQALENRETIKEALEKGYLRKDWIVGKDMVTGKELDYNSGYSLSNIRKLRKARVVPLGLEFAALKIVEGGKNYTLGEIVDAFKDKSSLFYKLVDPNWVLKLPQTFCRTRAYGQILEAAESDRRQEGCVDHQSCLYDDDNGNCLGGWGYCIREQNIWRFAGTECPAHYASCQTFQFRKGGRISYLKDTLDWDCEANETGCRWYSKTLENNNWREDKRIYFNRNVNVEECKKPAEGCHEFIELNDLFDGSPGSSELGGEKNLEKIVSQVVANTALAYDDFGISNYLYLNKKRKTCNPFEVGCERYTPINGDPWISGIISENDLCPAECVGYAFFKEMPTTFSKGRDPLALIAKTARTCPAQETGCEEFTNLDIVAKGGEGREYYSYLRQCVKLDKDNQPIESGVECAPFYTWVGSDTVGYQLKTYFLKKDLGTGKPAETDNPVNLGECKSTEDAIYNPECKEFYNEKGEVSYHFYKNTITCSKDCFPYRRTIISEEDCVASSGDWKEGACVYMAIPQEGVRCSSAHVNCREYKGNAGNNIRIVFRHDFERGTNEEWTGVISNEAVDANTHSLEVTDFTEKKIDDLLTPNRSYLISFWAKEGGNIEVILQGKDSDAKKEFGVIYSPLEWEGPFQLGPIHLDEDWDPLDNKIVISSKGTFYLDNIILKEITNQYLIKDSWKTPETCDQIPGEPPISREHFMINCQEYKDRENKSHYLKSFTKLCPKEAIGCKALIDTQNSTKAQEEKFNIDDPPIDDVVVPADKVVYLIKDKGAFCRAEDKGCQKFGSPKFELDEIKEYQDIYLRNNPDKYPTILCSAKADRCEEYLVGLSRYYFKDPGGKVCEYRKDVNIEGELKSGWFKRGKNEFCYQDYSLKKFDEPGYKDWVGLCPANQNNCTEFIDPQNKKSYYYLNNEQLDRASCRGQVSLKEGCVLFKDTSLKDYQTKDENLLYDSKATYEESDEKEGKAVNPLPTSPDKCGTNCDANVILKVQRDRVCGQWARCADARPVIVQGRQRDLCTSLELCQRSDKDIFACSDPENGSTGNPFNENFYKNRDITWKGMDYSGYALPNQYSLELLKVNKEKKEENGKLIELGEKLTYLEKTSSLWTAPNPCKDKVNAVHLGDYWYCDKGVNNEEYRINKSCRGYPEPNSPFGASVGSSRIESGRGVVTQINAPGFQNANVFKESRDKFPDDCDYKKVEYRNMDKIYYAKDDPMPSDENSIIPNSITVDNQTYNKKREDQFLGWRGYCLETDPSISINNDPNQKACLTWYPTDLLPGEINIFESDFTIAEIGNIDPNFGPYYCLEVGNMPGQYAFATASCDLQAGGNTCGWVMSCCSQVSASCVLNIPPGWEIFDKTPRDGFDFNVVEHRETDSCNWGCNYSGGGCGDGWNVSLTRNPEEIRKFRYKRDGGYISFCGGRGDTPPNHKAIIKATVTVDLRKSLPGCTKIVGIPSENRMQGSGVKRWAYKQNPPTGECGNRRTTSDSESKNLPNSVTFGNEKFVAYNGAGDWGDRKCDKAGTAMTAWGSIDAFKPYFVAGDVYRWDGSQYVKEASWRDFGVSGSNPVIKQAIPPKKETESWGEGRENRLTIGSYSSGEIGPEKGKRDFLANLRFFAYAQADQVPIRKIKIDWGDEKVTEIEGSFKNRRANCAEEKDSTVCLAIPFHFTHKYRCAGSGECTFVPKVTVIDNWDRSATAQFDGQIVIKL